MRVRAAGTGEIVWETVISAPTVESLPVLQESIQATEPLLGLAGDSEEAQGKRVRTEIRLDSSWGSEAMITWLLERGYHVTGKFKSNGLQPLALDARPHQLLRRWSLYDHSPHMPCALHLRSRPVAIIMRSSSPAARICPCKRSWITMTAEPAWKPI